VTATDEICRAAELINQGDCVVAFTGAGLSTASGIPDFRSMENGLWSTHDPMEVASLQAFRLAPERFYKWARPVAASIAAAAPNAAHHALKDLERPGRTFTIVTQNIDDLHQKAGSNRVIEIHGNFQTLICAGCRRTYRTGDVIEPFPASLQVPRCPICGCTLKPGAVLFGEELPLENWRAAEQACRECDVMIVAGTSLEVHPAAQLPDLAVRSRASIISVNEVPIPIDRYAAVSIRGLVEDLLPAIAAEVKTLG
jgi:NAD-dependent deacetylase